MTRFIIGLLLGLLLGIGGTAAFLITAGGGDYLVVSSPRVRELEASLKSADQDREWLRKRLSEANDVMARLESRFVALSSRFDSLGESVDRDAKHGAARLAQEAERAIGARSPGVTSTPAGPADPAHAPAAGERVQPLPARPPPGPDARPE